MITQSLAERGYLVTKWLGFLLIFLVSFHFMPSHVIKRCGTSLFIFILAIVVVRDIKIAEFDNSNVMKPTNNILQQSGNWFDF